MLRSLKWTAPVDLEQAKVRRALGKALSSRRIEKEAKAKALSNDEEPFDPLNDCDEDALKELDDDNN